MGVGAAEALAPARAAAAAPASVAAAPPPAWTLDQKLELVDLVANKSSRETEKLLAELEPEVGLPRERQRALGGGRYEVRVIVDQGSVDTIAKLKGWLSHVNPGFTTGQLLAYLLQQAERKYDPMRERGRTKRGAAAPARNAETCEQQLGATAERRPTGSALGAGVSKAGSSTCATGEPGGGAPTTGAAGGSVTAGSVASAPAPAPAAAGPSGALAGGSAQNRRTEPVAAPGSEQDRADTTGSAQNQRAALVPDRSSDRIPYHAARSVDAGFGASAPTAAGPSGALAGGSAQNRGTEPVAAPGSEQDRRNTTGSAQNQQRQPEPAPGSEQDRRHTTGSAQNQRAALVPDRSGDRIPYHAARSVDAGFGASAPTAAGPSGALAGGSAQNRGTEPVAAPGSEQDRADTTGSAQNQQRQPEPGPGSEQDRRDTTGSAQNQQRQPKPAPGSEQDRRDTTGSAQNQRAALVPDRSGDRIPYHAARSVDAGFGASAPTAAGLPEAGSAVPPPAPASSRARRARRHIPAAVRRAVWRRCGGACCYQDPLTGVTCGSTHLVQIDHIVPLAQGGSDDISNLRLRCAVHNRRRDPRCASYRSATPPPRGRSRNIRYVNQRERCDSRR